MIWLGTFGNPQNVLDIFRCVWLVLKILPLPGQKSNAGDLKVARYSVFVLTLTHTTGRRKVWINVFTMQFTRCFFCPECLKQAPFPVARIQELFHRYTIKRQDRVLTIVDFCYFCWNKSHIFMLFVNLCSLCCARMIMETNTC